MMKSHFPTCASLAAFSLSVVRTLGSADPAPPPSVSAPPDPGQHAGSPKAMPGLERVPPEVREKLLVVHEKAMLDPKVQAALEKYRAMNKELEAAQAEVFKIQEKYRAAEKEFRDLLGAVMATVDPSLEPVLKLLKQQKELQQRPQPPGAGRPAGGPGGGPPGFPPNAGGPPGAPPNAGGPPGFPPNAGAPPAVPPGIPPAGAPPFPGAPPKAEP